VPAGVPEVPATAAVNVPSTTWVLMPVGKVSAPMLALTAALAWAIVVTLAWMATMYLGSTAIFQIPFAKIADIYGRKKLFSIGLLIFAVATIACGFAPNTEILLALRFTEGIGSAIIFGTGMAILVSLYPAELRGRVLGINTSVVYASLAAGPYFGGLMTDY
jgi:MFS family permease